MEQSSLPTGAPHLSPAERVIVAPATNMPQHANEQAPGAPQPERGGSGEQATHSAGASGQPVVAPPAAPPQVQPVVQSQSSTTTDDDHPQIAEDVDVIEKEWVDKAKQIVDATKDDPRAQERKVSELQSVYLKKRYGKDIGVSEE